MAEIVTITSVDKQNAVALGELKNGEVVAVYGLTNVFYLPAVGKEYLCDIIHNQVEYPNSVILRLSDNPGVSKTPRTLASLTLEEFNSLYRETITSLSDFADYIPFHFTAPNEFTFDLVRNRLEIYKQQGIRYSYLLSILPSGGDLNLRSEILHNMLEDYNLLQDNISKYAGKLLEMIEFEQRKMDVFK